MSLHHLQVYIIIDIAHLVSVSVSSCDVMQSAHMSYGHEYRIFNISPDVFIPNPTVGALDRIHRRAKKFKSNNRIKRCDHSRHDQNIINNQQQQISTSNKKENTVGHDEQREYTRLFLFYTIVVTTEDTHSLTPSHTKERMGKWIRKTVQKFTDTETYTMLPDSMRMRLSMLSVVEEPLQLHVGSAELDSRSSLGSARGEHLASNDEYGAVAAAAQHGGTVSTGTIIIDNDNRKSDNSNIIQSNNSMDGGGLKQRSPKIDNNNNNNNNNRPTEKEVNDNNNQKDNDNKKTQRPRKLCSACTIPSTLKSKYNGCKHSVTLFLREHLHWKYLKICQLLCVVYIVIYTYGGFEGTTVRQADTGFIVDPDSEERTQQGIILSKNRDGTTTERAIVATSTFQLVCLSMARITAFYMYPTLVLIFFSKLRATANFVAQTPFGMFLYDDWHDLHVYCGWSIFVNSVLHTVFHTIRYYDQGTMELIATNRSGLSGLIVSEGRVVFVHDDDAVVVLFCPLSWHTVTVRTISVLTSTVVCRYSWHFC